MMLGYWDGEIKGVGKRNRGEKREKREKREKKEEIFFFFLSAEGINCMYGMMNGLCCMTVYLVS